MDPIEQDAPAAHGLAQVQGLALIKGHGTGNDFLLTLDPEADLPWTQSDVAALCDRRRGIGADGAIRAVRVESATTELLDVPLVDAQWFMDYRNSDGSVSQMCGNGIRVFVAFLMQQGLIDLPDGDVVPIATRAGELIVRREGDQFAVDMGPWTVPGGDEALAAGSDVSIDVAGLPGARPGLRVAVPNPHAVIALTDPSELEKADLSTAPVIDPLPADGANVELVVPLGEQDIEVVDETGDVVGTETVGVVKMRVHERGSGETESCGTGACAAAIAVRSWFGDGAPDTWFVEVPGGQLRVTIMDNGHVELTGPAELTAQVSPLSTAVLAAN